MPSAETSAGATRRSRMRGGATGSASAASAATRAVEQTSKSITSSVLQEQPSPHAQNIMGRKGQAALGAGAHEEEFAELQRRFDALSSAKKLSETSPALLTKDMYRTEKKQQAVRRDDPQLHAQLKTLDEQIVQLRRRHDRLHDNNNKKRRELDLLADRLQDLHNSAFKSEDAPQVRLRAQEERLVAAAHRYEESHRTKLTYEQVIERLKTEQLSWPEEVKALDTTLVQKEADYEQLLLMSHGARPFAPRPPRCPPPSPRPPAAAPRADANSSKEAAKAELTKFESLVADERRMRERELNRRQALQKKQTLATELEKNERERRGAPGGAHPRRNLGAHLGAISTAPPLPLQESSGLNVAEDALKQQTAQINELIADEGRKIRAYEEAFDQIKQATGVADVNEVHAPPLDARRPGAAPPRSPRVSRPPHPPLLFR